tara:strand:+ start:1587 stop:2096 length:510 start_codon:yes stop_codon:yes gene_type:complete
MGWLERVGLKTLLKSRDKNMPKRKRLFPKIKLSKTTSRDRARRSHLAGEIRKIRKKYGRGYGGFREFHEDAGKKFPKGHRLAKSPVSKTKLKQGFSKKTWAGSENRKELAKEVRKIRKVTGASPNKKAYRKISSEVKLWGHEEGAQKPKKKQASHPIMRARKAGFRYPL